MKGFYLCGIADSACVLSGIEIRFLACYCNYKWLPSVDEYDSENNMWLAHSSSVMFSVGGFLRNLILYAVMLWFEQRIVIFFSTLPNTDRQLL